MVEFTLSNAVHKDANCMLELYRAVAAVEGGLARTADEITPDYVGHFLSKAIASGVSVIARSIGDDSVIGEIHAYELGPKVFSHVLGELTIAVHPRAQGLGVGRALFSELMRQVINTRPDILRVELIARESNQKAIRFYESLGFAVEGRFAFRIRSVDGGLESDIPMAWLRDAK